MIKEETFAAEWLEQFRKQIQYRKINPPVFEKMVYALLLLERLVQSGLEFIFKGGTSMVLLIKNPDRFSVDIDIMTEESKADIEKSLKYVVSNSQFTGWEEDLRESNVSVPKAHYRLFYKSDINPNAEILLDVLFEKCYYLQTVKVPVASSWVMSEEPYVEVTVPGVDSLLGDKLTAFAPNTTGIPYHSGKHIEIIKQLHDVGRLADNMIDIKLVADTFRKVAMRQIDYRKLAIGPEDVCDDIIDTALMIARESRKMNKGEDTVKMAEIQDGIRGFQGFLMYGGFHLADAVVAAAKSAYLAAKIKTGDNTPVERYSGIVSGQINNMEYNYLNRMQKINKEAFYYWKETFLILKLEY